MIGGKMRIAAATISGLVVFAFAIAVAGYALSGRTGFVVALLPCLPGQVKTTIQEAGSCLGDYKNRKANEPIAFCVRSRTACVART